MLLFVFPCDAMPLINSSLDQMSNPNAASLRNAVYAKRFLICITSHEYSSS